MMQKGWTRRSAIGGLAGTAVGHQLLAGQHIHSPADLVTPHSNIFIDSSLSDAEASVAQGAIFKLVDSGAATVEVRRRTATGSDKLYVEATVAALASPDPGKGAAMLRMMDGADIQQAIAVASTPSALLASTTPLPEGATIRTANGFLYAVVSNDTPDYHVTTASGAKLNIVEIDTATVEAYGAIFSGDESALAQKMLNDLGVLRVPSGRVLTCKNIQLSSNSKIKVDGALRLPDNCKDFDRLLFASEADGLKIHIKEIDGNRSGQSGNIGTHLIYLVNCDDADVIVDYIHDHYIASGFVMPNTAEDGRNSSTGAVWLYRCKRAEVRVKLLTGWSREGLYLEECEDSSLWLGHAQATLYLEYSGVQVKGLRNVILRASVDNAGASGVGFDTIEGRASNIIVTNNRFRHGLNLGHPGFPASRSTFDNLVIDGAWENGITIAAGSEDISISNFSIRNCGSAGLQASDDAKDIRAVNGVIANCGRWNTVAGNAEIIYTNVKNIDLDPMTLTLIRATGHFVEGETVTGTRGAGVVRKILAQTVADGTASHQRLLLRSVTGTFAVPEVIIGRESGASGTVAMAGTPLQYYEIGTGRILDDTRAVTSEAGTYIPYPDGTAEFWGSIDVTTVTPGIDASASFIFPAGMLWADRPIATTDIISNSSDENYCLIKKQVSSSVSNFTVTLNTSIAQTYGVAIHARGRWR